MIKVFIGGSRRLSKLNEKVTQTLNNIMDKGFTIIIGDANGADKAVQNYLLNEGYKNVIVFCMQDRCRNNLGNWQCRFVETSLQNNDFQFYATKDLEMVKYSDYGFMLWDSKSKGTINNIANLLKESKPVAVYFSPTKTIHKIYNFDDLTKLLQRCDQSLITKYEKELSLSQLTLQRTPESIDK